MCSSVAHRLYPTEERKWDSRSGLLSAYMLKSRKEVRKSIPPWGYAASRQKKMNPDRSLSSFPSVSREGHTIMELGSSMREVCAILDILLMHQSFLHLFFPSPKQQEETNGQLETCGTIGLLSPFPPVLHHWGLTKHLMRMPRRIAPWTLSSVLSLKHLYFKTLSQEVSQSHLAFTLQST